MSVRPFDDILALLADLPGPDMAAQETARDSAGGGMGGLAEIAGWAAAWSGRPIPQVNRPILALYAGAHASVSAHGGLGESTNSASHHAGRARLMSCAS